MPTKKAVEEVVDNLEVVEEVVDKAIEGVDAIDHASHVAAVATKRGLRVLKRPQSAIIVLGVTGVVIGTGIGVGVYFLLKKRLQKKYDAQLEQEVEEVRASYKRRVKRQEYASPEEAAEALHVYQGDAIPTTADIRANYDKLSPREKAEIYRAIRDALENASETKVVRGRGDEPGYVEVETEVAAEDNEFIDDRPVNPFDWNQDVELSKRDPDSPYVISFEEFNENSTDWEQNNLVYYEADDVLADERDNPIPEIEATVGYDNLQRFGHGSQDPNVVYVRNERNEALFEIIRNKGSFADQVVGLKHSDVPKRRRSRRDWGDDE